MQPAFRVIALLAAAEGASIVTPHDTAATLSAASAIGSVSTAANGFGSVSTTAAANKFTIDSPDSSKLSWLAPPNGTYPLRDVPACPDPELCPGAPSRKGKLMIGYLTVPMDYDEMSVASQITRKLRVSLIALTKDDGSADDEVQPLLYHCGGPHSDDTCASMALGPNRGGNYHAFGIAQRFIADRMEETIVPHSSAAIVEYYRLAPSNPEGQYCNQGRDGQGPTALEDGSKCDYRAVPEWPPKPNTTYTLRNLTNCPCLVPPDQWLETHETLPFFGDPMDSAYFQAKFDYVQQVQDRCYNHPHWQVEKTTADGTFTFNVLDYVGTHLLGRDLETFRQAIGAKELNFNVVSYGTAVGSTYAAMYPENVGRLLLNGNMARGPGLDDFYADTAKGQAQVMHKLNTICDGHQLLDDDKLTLNVPGKGDVRFATPCAGHHVGGATEAFHKLSKAVAAGQYSRTTFSGGKFVLTPSMVYSFIGAIGSARQTKSWRDTIAWLSALQSDDAEISGYATKQILDKACGNSGTLQGPMTNQPMAPPKEVPTVEGAVSYWYWFNSCPMEDWGDAFDTNAVAGSDYINRFSSDAATHLHKALAMKYGPFEMYMTSAFAAGKFGWPALSTPAVYGWRENVKALIVGNLYDGATPFENTEWMRASFPGSVLLTWQGIGHLTINADYDPEGVKRCTRKMDRYMTTGELPVDGDTCRQSEKIKLKRPSPATVRS